jgi:hypothetical protein
VKVIVKDQNADEIQTVEGDDAEEVCREVGEVVGVEIFNEMHARQIVDVVER